MNGNRNIGVYILFKTDPTQAKAGAGEIKGAVEGVTTSTRASAEAESRAAASIDQNTAARNRQAEAARAQAEAERQARHAAMTAAGAGAAWRAELMAARETLNPAVAAHRELREAINGVETAEAMGVLTAREATIAIDQMSRGLTLSEQQDD